MCRLRLCPLMCRVLGAAECASVQSGMCSVYVYCIRGVDRIMQVGPGLTFVIGH